MALPRLRADCGRLKRSAFWFLGEYCCPLTGTRRDHGTQRTILPGSDPSGAVDPGQQAATAETGLPEKGVAGQGNTSSALIDLLSVWTNTPGTSRDDAPAVEMDKFSAENRSSGSVAAAVTDLRGIEDEAGSKAVPHQMVAAMNGATVSMLLRLKHAAMFEDLQVMLMSDNDEQPSRPIQTRFCSPPQKKKGFASSNVIKMVYSTNERWEV